MTLGQFLVQYRTSRSLSQRQFALMCNVSNGYIAMIEKGLNPKTKKPIVPTLPQLKKLASGMGMSVSALVDAVDDMPVDLSSVVPRHDTSLESTLSATEQELICKFRMLDDRGKAAVLNTLEYEYKSLTGEKTESLPRQA